MKIYMYNVLFDFSNNNGLFSPTDDQNAYNPLIPFPLNTSKNWMVAMSPGQPPGPLDPDLLVWDNLGEATSLHVRRHDEVRIRVAPDLRGPLVPSASATVQIVVSFGRPVHFKQDRASPFTHDATHKGDARTVFGPTPVKTKFGAWSLNLGEIAFPTSHGKQELADRYEFSLGIIVTEPATVGPPPTAEVVRHYGEDPEMDVGD